MSLSYLFDFNKNNPFTTLNFEIQTLRSLLNKPKHSELNANQTKKFTKTLKNKFGKSLPGTTSRGSLIEWF